VLPPTDARIVSRIGFVQPVLILRRIPMKRALTLAIAALGLATAAHAGGDPAKGEKIFKKCKSCHAIVAPDGTAIVKGGKVGPNLYGVIGRKAGSYEGYKYSKALKAAGENGLVWSEEELAKFVANPKKYLGGKSKMSFKLRKGGEDVAAYLASVAKSE